MVFGTFDVLHKGHLNFFKQARGLSKKPFLIASLARDVNVYKIKNKKPVNSEIKRLTAVKNSRLVDRAVLGAKGNYLGHVLKEKPDIIALGYDQIAYVDSLKRDIQEQKLKISVKRLKAYYPKKYKSSLLQK
jgi:FAD synthetase